MTNTTHRIVVGIDLSETADVALIKAFELAAKEEKSEVHVVHVVQHLGEFVQMDLPQTPAYRLPLNEAQDKLEAHVGGKLAEWQEASGKTFARCITHLSTEFPAVAIAQLGADVEADLVVVATHGRQGFKRFVLGSVAEAVVRLAQAPVLVVRPKNQNEIPIPEIQPPCPRCVEARKASHGEKLWCDQHNERHGRRHTYHYENRVAKDGNIGGMVGLR